ncbi:phage late control D family protein [Haladaptatus sp. NG-SE-30]
MSLAAFREKYNDFYVPRFKIDLAGTELTEASGIISDLSVSTSHSKANHFSFTLNNLFNPEESQFEDIDWEFLETEGVTKISMGYGDALEPMLVGKVESAEPEFPANGVPTIGVSGYGRLHELMSGTKSETWDKDPNPDRVTDAAVVEKVLERGEYGFDEVTIDKTDLELPRIVQDNKTDYDFLTERAKRYNYEVFVQRDSFGFRAPRDGEPPKVQLAYGESLLSFSPQLNKTKDVKEIRVEWSNRRGRKKIEASVKGNDPNGETKVIRTPVESTAEAKRRAESEDARIRQNRVRGSGETIGLPELVAGTTVQLDGLTDRFSGTYYIESADHSISTGGYTTSFQARLVQEVAS